MIRLPFKIFNRISSAFIIIILLFIFSANIAMAASPSEEERMTPSDQMTKQAAAQDGQPTEIQLNDGQQNLMLSAVAGIFIIIPVGIWIISHQIKRNRKRQEES